VFLKAPQVSLEQVNRSFGIPRIDARSPQTDYAAFLLLYDAPPLSDELLGAAKLADAQKFMERFGGKKFNRIERGRGANWARWNKRDNT
jgi:hypothetical protein